MTDNSTAAKQKAEKKENLPKMETVHVSKNIVNESIDKQGVNSKFEFDQQNLSAEVLYAKKDSKEKGIEKKYKNKNLFDKATKAAGLEGDQEVTNEFYDTFNDEKKLGKEYAKYAKLRSNEGWLTKVLGKGGSGDSQTRDRMAVIIEKYVSDEKIKTKDGTTQWKMKTFEEVMGKGKLNIFQKFWLRITHPFEYAKYRAAQKQAKYLRFGKSAEKVAGTVEDVKDEAVDKIKKGQEVVHQTKEEKRRVMTQLRIAKLEKKEKLREITKFKGKWGADMKEANMKIAKWGPEKYNRKIAKISQRGVQDVTKLGPEAIKAVGAGKVPGMKLGKVGSASIISVGVMTLREALRAKSFGEFSATVTKTSWLMSAAELLPIIGTIRSAQRIGDNSMGTSKGMRWAEFGINIGLDLFTVATLGAGSGIAAGARLALKGGTKGAAKLGAKALAKKAGKELLAEGTEATVKKVGKKEAGKASDKVLAKSIAKAGAKTTKETAVATMKTTLSKTSGKTWRKVWGHMPWLQAGYEGVESGATWAWKKFGPKNQTFSQAAVNVGVKKVLKPNQQKVVNLFRKGVSKAA